MTNLKAEDAILSELASLYESRGYKRYKPGCFEDYSLYLENIDFLISKNVITFSGAEGRLLALRPDVTLSVISHIQCCGQTDKLFYAEKVYRRSGGGEFRDINQTGVEVVGNIDRACEAEVACLVVDTLSTVSGDYLLDLSHMGYTEGLMASFNLPVEKKDRVYSYLRGKNVHDFAQFAIQNGLSQKDIDIFAHVVNIGGDAAEAVARAQDCAVNDEMARSAAELGELVAVLNKLGCGKAININFSIANNADYYNGVIFNGYVGGVPRRVLSGGRYDKLLSKMGKNGGAIGFALYMDELERYFRPDGNFVDFLILYDDESQLNALERSRELLDEGKSVRISREVPQLFRFGKTVDLRGGKR